MLFKDLSLDIIKQSIADLRQANIDIESKTREKLKDFYEDRQLNDEYLADYGFKEDNGNYLIPMSNYNITKKIIDKISLLYKDQPDYDNKLYTEWNNDNPDMYLAKKTAERYKNLLHHVILRPVFFNGVIYPYVETDYLAHFTDVNPLIPYGYSIPIKQNVSDPNAVDEDTYVFWSDQYYFFYDSNGKTYPDEDFPDMNNPYGINPCVEYIKSFPVDQYGGSGAISLVSANEAINVAMADLNLMIHHQAFDQPYGTGMSQDDAVKLKLSTKLWFAPEGSNFGLLGFNPKIMETIEAIKFQMSFISNIYNVNINWNIEGDTASGVALKIRNIDLLEAREDDKYFAIAAEKKLYKVIRAMNEYHKLKPALKDEALIVNFYDMGFPLSVDEQIKKDEHELKYNLTSQVELIQRKDPDLDDEQAKQRIQENKTINGNLTRGERFQQLVNESVQF